MTTTLPKTDEIERIKRQIGVYDLAVSEGVEMKKMGKNYVALCVFHKEKTPSLIFTPEKNLFHCPGCGKGGSPIDWVMLRQSVDTGEAIKILKAKLPQLFETKPPAKIEAVKLDLVSIEAQRILQRVIEYAGRLLKQNPQALEYLQSRHVTHPEILTEFQIGFLDSTFAERLPGGKEGQALKEQLKQLGILTDKGRVLHQGCLVFPIFDEDGRIVQIYGRRIESRNGFANHVNLPQSLRGFFNQKAFISKEIILCEAVLDALSFWVNGFRNVTCALGVNGLSDEHLRTFSQKETERVFIAFDNDEAGNRRAGEISSLLAGLGIQCFRVEFPEMSDANDYIGRVKNPAESLKMLLSSAKPMEVTAKKATEKPLFAGVLAPKADGIAWEKIAGSYFFSIGNRVYKVVGLERNSGADTMKIYFRLNIEKRFHMDNSIDLYNFKDRKAFVRNAAETLEIEEEIIRKDVDQIILELEKIQEDYLQSLLKTESKEIVMSEHDVVISMEFLRHPDLLNHIIEDFAKIGLVGEDSNALITYLVLTSRKSDKPLAVIIQSSSGAGKTTLMDSVLSLMPDEDVVKFSAMTGQSLFYMGDKSLKNKILAIVEEEGAQRVSYSLKLLQSEGEISIASTGKDPVTGKMITHEYKVEGPVTLMIATTSIDIDPELQNRCLTLTVNESREQTRRIQDHQRFMETLEGQFQREERKDIRRKHQNAQRLLRDLWVNNPFAEDLAFPDASQRLRRDNKKYLTLIRTVALLQQHQREIKTTNAGGRIREFIEVNFSDIEWTHKLSGKAFGTTLDELPPVTRNLLEQIQLMVENICKAKKIDQEDLRITRREIREHTGMSNNQLQVHLLRLVEFEYLTLHRGRRGQTMVYELFYHGEGKDGAQFMLGLTDLEKLRRKIERKKPKVLGVKG